MSNKATASSSTISGAFSIHHVPAKLKHECTHCGFETGLYESGTRYKCPVCVIGILCRPAQSVDVELLTWYQDCNSSCAGLQKGFYGPGRLHHVLGIDGAPSAPIYDGYLFEEVDNVR